MHSHGITDIQTSAQAAEALRPVAGRFVFFVFAAGIIGTGLLALPVLAGSSAYAIGEAIGMHVGLARKPRRAKRFYAAIALATLLGAVLNMVAIDPVKALFWSAVINGVAAAPIMVVMMRLRAAIPASWGALPCPPALTAIGWLATAVMALAAVAMIGTMVVSGPAP